MRRKRIWTNVLSIVLLTVPNTIYLCCNIPLLREANVVALSMTALLVLSIIGLGTLAHFKANAGVWAMLIGVFILALSNIAWVAGIALLIEGAGLAIDGYALKPLALKLKTEELKENGESVTYTREIK